MLSKYFFLSCLAGAFYHALCLDEAGWKAIVDHVVTHGDAKSSLDKETALIAYRNIKSDNFRVLVGDRLKKTFSLTELPVSFDKLTPADIKTETGTLLSKDFKGFLDQQKVTVSQK